MIQLSSRLRACSKAFAFAFALLMSSAQANVIFFGDSLSDMGNNTWVTGSGFSGAPITNQPTAAARLLWPNLLVSALDGKPVTTNDPYLSSSRRQTGYNPLVDNVNYAYASAESGADYVNDLDNSKGYPPYIDCQQPGLIDKTHACVPGVLLQVQSYLQEVSNQPSPHTMFIIWVGGNDFFNDVSKLLASAKGSTELLSRGFNQLNHLFSGYPVVSTGVTFSNPVSNIRKTVDRLLKAGVDKKQIYVFNLPDLSKAPAAVALAKGNKLVLGAISVLSAIYNTSLKADLCYNWFDKNGNLPANHVYSISSLFNLIESNSALHKKYHLTDLVDSCVDKGEAPVCQGFAFFNGKHPTLEVEHVVSDYFHAHLNGGGIQ